MEKWVVMQELEDSDTAMPCRIVATEEKAEALCYRLEKQNPGFIFWPCVCEEEDEK